MCEINDVGREFSVAGRTWRAIPTQKKVIEISPLTRKPIELDLKELRFLHYLRPFFEEVESAEMSYAEAIEKAAVEAGVTAEWGAKDFERSGYGRWGSDRLE